MVLGGGRNLRRDDADLLCRLDDGGFLAAADVLGVDRSRQVEANDQPLDGVTDFGFNQPCIPRDAAYQTPRRNNPHTIDGNVLRDIRQPARENR